MTRPAIRDRLLDRALAAARARLAALGLVATPEQLHYEVCRAVAPLPLPARGPGFLLPRPVPRAAFAAALIRAGGPDPLPERVPVAAGTGPDTPDLLDYPLPRVLVCQHERLAAALVANDLHMEGAAAVLGPADGAAPPPALRSALAAAPDPVVFLLHDATPAGLTWLSGTWTGWAPARVQSLGLRPAQARRLHLFRGDTGAEVAAVPPDHLLRVLRRLLSGRPRRAAAPTLRQRARVGFLSWPGEGR
jgi:hypothetical protein